MRPFSVALLGGLRLSGRLRPGERLVRIALIGGMDLDLSEAEFADTKRLTVVKVALIGGLEMRVPKDAQLKVHSLAIGGRNIDVGSPDVPTASPTISIYAFGLLGGVKITRDKNQARAEPQQHSHGSDPL